MGARRVPAAAREVRLTPVVLTNECWLGYHPNCEWESGCECLCHVTEKEIDAFLSTI